MPSRLKLGDQSKARKSKRWKKLVSERWSGSTDSKRRLSRPPDDRFLSLFNTAVATRAAVLSVVFLSPTHTSIVGAFAMLVCSQAYDDSLSYSGVYNNSIPMQYNVLILAS